MANKKEQDALYMMHQGIKTYVKEKITEAQISGGEVDLSNYVTKTIGNANQITFSDGQTFQEKFNNGVLKGEQGETGPQGEQGIQGEKGDTGATGADGLTTSIKVNNATYNHVNGIITLPNYPTVPTNISSFTNDSNYATETFVLENVNTVLGPGSGASSTSSLIITDTNNYFYSKSVGDALSYLYNLIIHTNDILYYNNLIYSLPQTRVLDINSSNYIDTGVKLFDPETKYFTVLLRFSNGKLNTSNLNAHTILHCMDEENCNGISLAINNGNVQFDYTNSSIVFDNITYDDRTGHAIVLCKDDEKIRVYIDSTDNYQDIVPKYALTEPLYKNLLVGCYQDANDTKGRFWDGTVFDLKIWEECFSEYNVKILLG